MNERLLRMPPRRHADRHMPDPARLSEAGSHWLTVLLILGSGIVSAFQVGKASVAMPSLQQSLAVELSTASWLLSAFALVGGVLGVWTGVRVDQWGARRMALAGLAIQALCSGLGAMTSSIAWLLVLRVIEGVGFLAVIVAGPAMIHAAAAPRFHAGAFAAWGTFMPLGLGAMMLAAPWLERIGWQGLWAANALVLAVYLAVLAVGTRRFASRSLTQGGPAGSGRTERGARGTLRQVIRLKGPWLIAFLFVLFTTMFFSVFSFLPAILSERLGLAADEVGTFSAVAIVMSAVGNLACGLLLARGVAPMPLMAVGFVIMGAATPGVLIAATGGAFSYALTLAVSLASGLVPVILFAAAARHSPSPTHVGATMGMAMQGNNLGLLIGPAVAGAIADAWGWSWVAAWVALLTVVALALIAVLRRMPRERALGREPMQEHVA